MIGQTVAHYTILEKLGEGGMGVVYKARDTRLDRAVALKFLPRHLVAHEAEHARFLQEAKAASAINHPNVCIIYAVEEHAGDEFIVMEYVEGMTLKAKIAGDGTMRGSPLRIESVVSYAVQIGEALQEAHTMGIVHRDVKAENIMVNSKNQIKVMDFGLAKLKGSLKLTKTSSTVGTLAYMAPEQIQEGDVDARSDIFSFGVVLFEMLTGRLPFRGEHDAAMMYSIVHEDPESSRRVRADVPPELDRIVERALEKDPLLRYQHVDDLVSELRRMEMKSSRVSRALLSQVVPRPPSTPDGPGRPGAALPQRRRRPWLLPTVGGAAVIAVGIAIYLRFFTPAAARDSLAVLPFVNAGTDPDKEYLSDGITESIINSLTRIPQLRVVPRTTVFRLKGKDIDPQELGTMLNVGTVLMGRVVQRGDDLNIQLDLIDVRSQSQIWGAQYQRKAQDVLALQDDIVNEVTRELQLSVNNETKQAVNKRFTENADAYKLYLQGRYYWNKRNAPDLQKAVGLFSQAIALDPNYALAYSGLADCYVIEEQYADVPGSITFPEVESAARKALELDNSLAEPHAALAFARSYEWDWAGAEQEFKNAIRANPQYPTAYHWYSILLLGLGRLDEARAAITRAQELDPLSPVILLNIAAQNYLKGAYDEAIAQCRKTLDMDASFIPAYGLIGQIYARKGMFAEALPPLQKAVELSGRSGEYLSYLGDLDARSGNRSEAYKIIAELEEKHAAGKGSAYSVARVYAGLGENDKVFQWLETDFREHSGWMDRLLSDKAWDSLKSNPRFIDLLKRVGLAK